jgi:hypothetical protein
VFVVTSSETHIVSTVPNEQSKRDKIYQNDYTDRGSRSLHIMSLSSENVLIVDYDLSSDMMAPDPMGSIQFTIFYPY